MKLYYFPLSTYSQKTLIALHEKGLAFDTEIVNLASAESRAAYEQVYPIGKVPYLKPETGFGLPESTAIIEYLDETFPDTPRLVPLDREAARQVRFSDRMCDLYVDNPVVELLFQKIGFRPVNEDDAARARKYLSAAFANMEQRLSNQDWLTGNAFTMADCAAIPPLFYAQFVFPFNDRPALSRYWQRAQQRPSYAKVMSEFVPIWEQRMAGARSDS
ncbi:glutathione S-transferase family protein [Pelomonas sp. KK5]|uniref:glutathione S-transferase family protein n=1 Tax=Pelomonas sp. KK5 TaxID=1855730 RepID=UPI00097BA9A2|nr:glutathione S-transferase family protein [Pelomonas sp. KK5]